jgi:hypothetical protein
MEDGNAKIAEQSGKNKLKGQQEAALAKVEEFKKKEKLVSGEEERTKQAEADASKKFYADRAKRQIAENKLAKMRTKQEKDQGIIATSENAEREMTERLQKAQDTIAGDAKDAIKSLRAEQGHIEVLTHPPMKPGVQAYERVAREAMRDKHLTWRASNKTESWIHARATKKLEEEGFKRLSNPANEKMNVRQPLDKAEQDQWLEENKQLFATDGLSHIKDMQSRGYTLPNTNANATTIVH